MANHIVPLICDRIIEQIQAQMINAISYSDPTRLNEVKFGRYQQDPSEAWLRASVQGGDLDEPDMRDGIVTLKEQQSNRTGFTVAAREIGGSEMWYRRGVVRLELFFIVEQMSEEDSRTHAYEILGRAQQLLPTIYVGDLNDDFGERAIKMFHSQNSMYPSGGPPTSYLWRGKLIWECLTERDWS